MSELLLGVDIWTSISKGILARPDGEVVATAERPHELSLSRPGWTELYGADGILSRCGSPLSSQGVGPKFAWLRRNEPEVWEKTGKFFMANSFIVHRLTGEYVLDHHSASQCDPLYDVHSYGWIEDWSEEIASGLPLPRLLWSADREQSHRLAEMQKMGVATET